MPKEGQKSITVRGSVYDIAKKVADQEGRSVSNMAEWAIVVYANKKKAGRA